MKELTQAINTHLEAEFHASHSYLSMSIWLREKDLAGFAEYMLNKSNEERGHASRMIDYLLDCDEQVFCPPFSRRNAPGTPPRRCSIRCW
ncbi:ferritin-like domain-containing protein [Synechococcus sp. L2F]|uniref:ferritin-like domain-containing protein n=1 Tax=Synechococcus sp. L2F TaxID=2823739 RepID=UPI0020CC1304|nr:ferritin-like domain-containing protein [Synechococcus sp. L2F]